ncbi:hypothetical protein GGR20_002161 [Devosia subaequoris]|uniref:Uncharacterized protein n=1 Tax=Devosia subaequoris TaxID=395930 RepID=A0A7W6IMU9_9HYPH|nr:hypothetical protein [Devosia subaequoris]MBB4052518.1 hypothetical protein [Devosia subaequoris]MCP1209675.1 hypothetical protein [Devosia subaequoris]
MSRSALSRHKQLHLIREVAHMECSERRSALNHAQSLLELADGLQAQAIVLFNAAAERGDEVAAAAWFDRTLKASSFRLSVQQARANEQDAPSAIRERMEEQARISKVAERFLQLWGQKSGERKTPDDVLHLGKSDGSIADSR